MKGGNTHKSGSFGYTIVEVMIFLAISGAMFVIAVSFINGKQASVDFRQGMQGANSLVKTVVNEVANGEYGSLGNYGCAAAPGAPPTAYPGGGSPPDQGANGGITGCTFLGKVIQLDVASDTTAYNVYSVASRQYSSGNSPVTTFAEAMPVPVGGTGWPDLTLRGTLQNGLEATGMLLCAANDTSCTSGTKIGAVGFFGSFGSYSANNSSDLQSGAQSIITAVVPNVTYGEGESNALTDLKNNLPNIGSGNILGSGNYVLLCFRFGVKTGSIVLGGPSGQQFATTIKSGSVPSACAS